jgi:hypothetical protein
MSLDQERLDEYLRKRREKRRKQSLPQKEVIIVKPRRGKEIHQFRTVKDPADIETSMKIDWATDQARFKIGWRTGGTTPVLVGMTPSTYLKLNPFNKSDPLNKESLKSIRKGLKDGSEFDTPYISLDADNRIKNQEGRHRATVLKELGETEMPVAIFYDL